MKTIYAETKEIITIETTPNSRPPRLRESLREAATYTSRRDAIC
jgi:hypothetical protein